MELDLKRYFIKYKYVIYIALLFLLVKILVSFGFVYYSIDKYMTFSSIIGWAIIDLFIFSLFLFLNIFFFNNIKNINKKTQITEKVINNKWKIIFVIFITFILVNYLSPIFPPLHPLYFKINGLSLSNIIIFLMIFSYSFFISIYLYFLFSAFLFIYFYYLYSIKEILGYKLKILKLTNLKEISIEEVLNIDIKNLEKFNNFISKNFITVVILFIVFSIAIMFKYIHNFFIGLDNIHLKSNNWIGLESILFIIIYIIILLILVVFPYILNQNRINTVIYHINILKINELLLVYKNNKTFNKDLYEQIFITIEKLYNKKAMNMFSLLIGSLPILLQFTDKFIKLIH